MAMAFLYGAGSGALHAVTGPDHVLSLGPLALRHPRASFRIGLFWGVGHTLGTLLLALPLLLSSQLVHLPLLAAWSERAAGLVLLAAAGWSWWSARRSAAVGVADTRKPFWVGVLHGATGAGSLLLVLPMLVSGSVERTLWFLGAFSLGSTGAMALLTSAIARLGARLESRVIAQFQAVFVAAALLLGLYWVVAG